MNDEFKLDYEIVINSPKATEWEKGFVTSVYEWSRKRPVSEKQKQIWDRIVKGIQTPKLEYNDLSEDQKKFIAKTAMLFAKTEDKWVIEFTNSLIDQIYKGKALTDKQMSTFATLYEKKMNPTPKKTKKTTTTK